MGRTIQTQEAKALNYFRAYLADVERCHFPKYDGDAQEGQKPSFCNVDMQSADQLRELSSKSDPTLLPGLFRAAWSIVLHCFYGLEDVLFEYAEISAMPSPRVLGDLVRMKLQGDQSVAAILERSSADYGESMNYGGILDGAETKALHNAKKNFCNTVLIWENGTAMEGVASTEKHGAEFLREVCSA